MAEWGLGITDIIFPRRCPLCRDIVVPKDKLVCPKCKSQIKWIQEPCCKKCYKPLASEEQEYCYDCMKAQHHYKKGFAVCTYEGLMKQSILDFKFRGKREYADFYVDMIYQHLHDKLDALKPDVIIPVPLHRRKQRIRGFNQAKVLADGIGEWLHVPVISDLLVRSKYTIPQKKLDDKERLRNLEQAFTVVNHINACEQWITGKRVLLVDDIYTTGSTIEACTNALLKAGSAEIYFVTVCIGEGF